MSNASNVRAGGAFIEITGEDPGLQAALARAAGRIQAFGATIRSIGASLVAAGAAITAPLLAAARASAESGAALYDMSKRTGISAENLSTLGFAAKMSGSDIETLEGSIKRMQKTIAGVEDATEGTTGSLKHLGLSAADLADQTPDQQFRRIAAAIAAIDSPSQRAAAAMKVFGRQGTALLPMIQRLSDLEGVASKLGFVKTDQGVAAAKRFQISMDLAGMATKSVWGTLQSALVPMLTRLETVAIGATVAVRDFVRAHRDAVLTAFKFGAAVGAAGSALIGMSVGISAVGRAVGVVSGSFSLARVATQGLVATINTLLVGGIGAAVAGAGIAIVGLGAYFLFATESGRQTLGQLADYFFTLADVARKAFGGVADALASGDWKLAAEVAWAGLKVAWAEGIAPLQTAWIGIKSFAEETWSKLGNGLANITYRTVAVLKTVWIEFQHWYTNLVNKIGNAWANHDEDLRHEGAVIKLKQDLDGGSISKTDYDKMLGQENRYHDRQTGAVDELAKQQAAANDAARDAALAKNDAELNGALQTIEQVKAADLQRIDETAAREAAANQRELEDKKSALDQLRRKAAEERKKDRFGIEGLLKKFSGGPGDGGGEIDAGLRNTQASVAGYFNANAAFGLGAGPTSMAKDVKRMADAADKQTKPAQDTARNTQKLADLGGGSFK